jgi:putative membrane protein
MDHKPGLTENSQGQQRGAQKRTNEHLANDRTGLAWIRTGLAIIGIGFVISRFGLLLRAQARLDLPSSTLHYSSLLGLVLVALGVFTLVFALISYTRIHLAIEQGQFPSTPWFLVGLMGFLAILGILLFLYMWLVS